MTIVIQGVGQVTGLPLAEAKLIGTLALLAEPYLLVRLVAHFRPLPRIQHAIGLGYIAVSWTLMIAMYVQGQAAQLPPAITLIIVAPFAYLEAYAALAFIRSAAVATGVTQKRLIAAAAGSGFFAVIIAAAGVLAFVAAPPSEVKIATDLFSLAAAISYYIGFAPPAWLKKLWQVRELEAFLSELAGQSAEDRFATALDRLGPSAARALGGKGAIVALGTETSDRLLLRPDSSNGAILRSSGLETLSIDETSPLIARAWRERRNIANSRPETWGPGLRKLAEAFGQTRSVLL